MFVSVHVNSIHQQHFVFSKQFLLVRECCHYESTCGNFKICNNFSLNVRNKLTKFGYMSGLSTFENCLVWETKKIYILHLSNCADDFKKKWQAKKKKRKGYAWFSFFTFTYVHLYAGDFICFTAVLRRDIHDAGDFICLAGETVSREKTPSQCRGVDSPVICFFFAVVCCWPVNHADCFI